MPSKEENTELKSERQKFKELMDVGLEQSFRSIDKFNFHHLGRITGDLEDGMWIGSYISDLLQNPLGRE